VFAYHFSNFGSLKSTETLLLLHLMTNR